MSPTRKILLSMLCLLCALVLTGCYTESDPWPSADELAGGQTATQTPAVSAVPTATPAPATAAPTSAPTPAVTSSPEPLPEDAVDISPNFNG